MADYIHFVPVASGLSNPLKSQETVVKFLKTINTSNLKIHEVITRIKQLSDLGLNELRSVIIFVVTGGTEKLIIELAKKAKFSLILAHKGMNSFPAALEAKSLLNYLGSSSILLKIDEPRKINEAIESLRVLHEFPKYLALIGEPSPWLVYSSRNEVVDFLKDSFGSEIINIGLRELVNKYSSITDDVVYHAVPKDLRGSDLEFNEIIKAFKLYLALKELLKNVGTKAFSIKCFDLINELRTTSCLPLSLLNSENYVAGCEGDLLALISMIIGSKISRKPSFMGNLVWLDKDEVILAHCTAPLSLVNSYELTTHYESGIGVGVRGYLKKGLKVTLFKLDPLIMEAKIFEGVVVESGKIVQEGCRTQFRIRVLLGDTRSLMTRPSGNHYVLILGWHGRKLKYVAELLGLQWNNSPASNE